MTGLTFDLIFESEIASWQGAMAQLANLVKLSEGVYIGNTALLMSTVRASHRQASVDVGNQESGSAVGAILEPTQDDPAAIDIELRRL